MFKQWQAQWFQSQGSSFSTHAETSLPQSLVNTSLSSWGSSQKYMSLANLIASRHWAVLPSNSWNTDQTPNGNPWASLICSQRDGLWGNLSSPRCASSDANPVLSNAYSSSQSFHLLGCSKNQPWKVCPFPWLLPPSPSWFLPPIPSFDVPLTSPWRTDVLGGQFWLRNGSVLTLATDQRISAPICSNYGLQKSVHAKLMDCTANIKIFNNMHIRRYLFGDGGSNHHKMHSTNQ